MGVGPILTPLYCGNGKNQKQICNMLNKEFFIRKIKGKKTKLYQDWFNNKRSTYKNNAIAKRKKTNNDLLNTAQKTTDWQHETHEKPVLTSGKPLE